MDELSRVDLEKLVTLAARCLEVSTAAELQEVISALTAVLAFHKAAACIASCGGGSLRLQHFINHSFGKSWEQTYTREQLQGVDPVLRHAQCVNGVFRWSDESGSIAELKGCSTFREAARDHGLNEGITFSAAARTGAERRTVITLSGVSNQEAARVAKTLAIIGPHLHEAYQRLVLEPLDLPNEALTDREKEVLNWTQNGKTYWEIGCILGISERTVKFHFQRIKEKLDVVTPSHAVARALRLGIIN